MEIPRSYTKCCGVVQWDEHGEWDEEMEHAAMRDGAVNGKCDECGGDVCSVCSARQPFEPDEDGLNLLCKSCDDYFKGDVG